MKNGKCKFVVTAIAMTMAGNVSAENVPVYRNAGAEVELRVEDLLKRMTTEEKVLQLTQFAYGESTNINNVIKDSTRNYLLETGSYIYSLPDPGKRNELQRRILTETRLGIPALFGSDVIHGFRTVYPISLAQGCSFNPALVEEACAMAARETRASGTDWTFSPMIDVARDPRWGRISEGYGEDPYLNGVMGAASVRGYQGTDLTSPDRVAACLKHYVAYGESIGGRDYRPANVSDIDLWNIYLPPYKAGVDAGVATVMSSFNDINGTPGSANPYTLDVILKKRWGFDGFVVSDWGSVEQTINQGAAEDLRDATRIAFNAGVDMDMCDGAYPLHLADLINSGMVSADRLDDAVRRVLTLKFRLGLFENPYTPDTPQEQRLLTPANIDVARRLAAESMVLLKNEGGLLPLADGLKIAVMGPTAKDPGALLGNWHCYGRLEDVETLWDGLEKEFSGKAQLSYTQGCDFEGSDRSGFEAAVRVAQESDVVILCLGEKMLWSGECCSRASIELQPIQVELLNVVKSAGKPVILVLANGRPLALGNAEPLADAIIEVWQPGIAGGSPFAGILSGRINPSGRLDATFPYQTNQIPMYYNHRRRARLDGWGNYLDAPSVPLYEFGHGLSYTNFEYGMPTVSRSEFGPDDEITVSVDVTNTGEMDGDETVLWYITDPVSTIARPVKELKHFEKRHIPKGQTATYTFTINPRRDLGWLGADGEEILEPGKFIIFANDKALTLTLGD